MKKKTITLVVYMLVCISLVSVGFAAWIITGGDESNTSGNIQATTVKDLSLVVSNEKWDNATVQDPVGSGSIVFGRPNENYTSGWLYAEEGDAVQKLNATYSFTLSVSDSTSSNTIGGLITNNLDQSLVSIKFTQADSIISAITAKYILPGTISYIISYEEQNEEEQIEEKKVTKSANISTTANETLITSDFLTDLKGVTSKTANISITISYGWGDTFGKDNPYTFYNKPEAQNGNATINGITYKEHARTNLQGLYQTLYGTGAVSKGTFSLVIQIGAVAPAAPAEN